MADYYRKVIARPGVDGFEFKRRGGGDHEIWWNPGTKVRLIVDNKAENHGQRNS
jgi:hypothetical protein